MFKLKQILLGVVGALAISSMASAATVGVNSILKLGQNTLSDNSAEYLIKGAGNTGGSIIQVGDRLRGIFGVDTIEPQGFPQQNIGGNTNNKELTGLFEIELVDKKTNGNQMADGTWCQSTICFQWGPSAAFVAEMAAAGWNNTTGAMVAFYEDAANDYARSGAGLTIADLEATAKGGTKFWLAGFGLATDYWYAGAGTDNIGVGATLPALTDFGDFGLAVSLLDRVLGPNLGDVDCATIIVGDTNTLSARSATSNFCGIGNLLAKGPTGGEQSIVTAYDSLDDVNFTIYVIPEPGILTLIGAGLLAVGLRRRRLGE